MPCLGNLRWRWRRGKCCRTQATMHLSHDCLRGLQMHEHSYLRIVAHVRISDTLNATKLFIDAASGLLSYPEMEVEQECHTPSVHLSVHDLNKQSFTLPIELISELWLQSTLMAMLGLNMWGL